MCGRAWTAVRVPPLGMCNGEVYGDERTAKVTIPRTDRRDNTAENGRTLLYVRNRNMLTDEERPSDIKYEKPEPVYIGTG